MIINSVLKINCKDYLAQCTQVSLKNTEILKKIY